MKKTYLLLLLSIFLFSACSSDDDDDNNPAIAGVIINYDIKHQDDSYNPHQDKGAKIFIFSDLTLSDVSEYKGNGVVILQDGKTKSSTQSTTTDSNGKATIKNIETNKNCIQYIESNGLPGLIYKSAFITKGAETYAREHTFKYDDYANLPK